MGYILLLVNSCVTAVQLVGLGQYCSWHVIARQMFDVYSQTLSAPSWTFVISSSGGTVFVEVCVILSTQCSFTQTHSHPSPPPWAEECGKGRQLPPGNCPFLGTTNTNVALICWPRLQDSSPFQGFCLPRLGDLLSAAAGRVNVYKETAVVAKCALSAGAGADVLEPLCALSCMPHSC